MTSDKFPRLLNDETLETAIRDRWFSEHNRDNAVYALQGEEFTDAIEKWLRKSFPEHAEKAKSLSAVIWLCPPVIAYQRQTSRGIGGFFKRLMAPRGEFANRWSFEDSE